MFSPHYSVMDIQPIKRHEMRANLLKYGFSTLWAAGGPILTLLLFNYSVLWWDYCTFTTTRAPYILTPFHITMFSHSIYCVNKYLFFYTLKLYTFLFSPLHCLKLPDTKVNKKEKISLYNKSTPNSPQILIHPRHSTVLIFETKAFGR